MYYITWRDMLTKQFEYIRKSLCDLGDNIYTSWSAWIDVYLTEKFLPLGIYMGITFVLFLAAWIILVYKGKYKKIFNWLSHHITISAVIVWLLGVVIYILGLYRAELTALAVVPRAIIASFKMFVVAHDLARVSSILQSDALYMSFFSIIHFSAALITFMFIFKMVGFKIKASFDIIKHRFFKAQNGVVHLFWGINEASILLAESIKAKYKTETIIFIDIDKDSGDSGTKKVGLSSVVNTITIKSGEASRLEELGVLIDHCSNGPVALPKETDIFGALNLKNIGAIVRKCSKSNFYFLSDDEAENISAALNLEQDVRLTSMEENSRPVIYIHARRDANNELFDHYSQYADSSNRLKIKIVDSAYLSVIDLKQNNRALPVKCVDYDKETAVVNSAFTSMVVGFNDTGQEAFKFLYEFSAFIDKDKKKSPFKCYAIDEKMNKMAGLIRKSMPAINENELELIQTSVDSEIFWDKVYEIIGKLNYVVITLNNDDLGLSLAVNLFKCALALRPDNQQMLKIVIRCYDNRNEKRMAEVISNLNKSVAGENVELLLFGEMNKIYSYEAILSDHLLKEAKEFHREYEISLLSEEDIKKKNIKPEDLTAEKQWENSFGNSVIPCVMERRKISRYHAIYDINRQISQNISNVLHSPTKLILMGLNGNDLKEQLDLYYDYVNTRESKEIQYYCNEECATLLYNMALVEHERWVASHKLMGYTYAPQNDFVRKHHKCMCEMEKLDEETQSYDCNVVDTTIKIAFEKNGV